MKFRNFTKALLHEGGEGHVFSKYKAKNKLGHVEDTTLNRRNMIETFVDPKRNFVGETQYKQILARPLGNCTESWVEIQKGKIKSAGVNGINRPIEYFNDKGNFLDKHAELAKNKQIQTTTETILDATSGIAASIAPQTNVPRNDP